MNEKEQLERLKHNAPVTWRCTDLYYYIAYKHGVSYSAPDAIRDAVIDGLMND